MESASTAFEKRRRVVNSDSMPNVMKVASPKLHHVQSENRTSQSTLHAGQLELEGQESPKPGRQVQLVRDTVPVLLGPGGAQKSDGPSHELQMGGPGPNGHRLATAALVLSPGRSELMATGTSCSSVRNTLCALRGPPHW